jgi:hypothetical protein
MAKLLTPYDLSGESFCANAYPPVLPVAKRDWGAVEYDTGLSINSSGNKVISPFDLSSYSQLVDLASVTPPVTDLRNQTVLGLARDWGALEYNFSLNVSGASKLVTPWDMSGYSRLINIIQTYPGVPAYCPAAYDVRGTTPPLNTPTPMPELTRRDFTATDIREIVRSNYNWAWGAVVYDQSLIYKASGSVHIIGG